MQNAHLRMGTLQFTKITRLYLTGADIDHLMISVVPEPSIYRSSVSVPGRRRPLRHLSLGRNREHVRRTQSEGATDGTVQDQPEFILYRLGVRFGLPVLADCSEWFTDELRRKQAIEPLTGIGRRPVLVKGTKKRFLGWIGHGLKRVLIPSTTCRSPCR